MNFGRPKNQPKVPNSPLCQMSSAVYFMNCSCRVSIIIIGWAAGGFRVYLGTKADPETLIIVDFVVFAALAFKLLPSPSQPNAAHTHQEAQ